MSHSKLYQTAVPYFTV